MTDPDPHGYDALHECAGACGFTLARDHFLFLRHGRTEGNRLARYQHPDDPLSADGLSDAAAAAEILRHEDFAAIHASTMARAWTTARHVADASGKKLIAMPDLRERYFGDLIGTSSRDIDWRHAPPNGETMQVFIDRTLAGAARALAGDAPALIVAHGGNLRVIAGALGVRLHDALTHNAVPLIFARDGRHWTARALPGEDMFDPITR